LIAYKFLRESAVGPFSGAKWPVPGSDGPGAWIRAAGALEVCGSGVHACRVEDLPLWLFDELWQVELEPPVQTAATHVVATAGRLRERIEAWNAATASEFAEACAGRAAELAETVPEDRASKMADYAQDASTWATGTREHQENAFADAACVAYIAAHAAGDVAGADAEAGERAWQSAWLANRLSLIS